MVAQALTGPAQATHHRPDRDPERLGGLLVRQLVDVDEVDDLAELERERVEGGVEVLVENADHEGGLGLRCLVLGRVCPPGDLIRVVQEVGAPAAHPVDLGVPQDRQQPRPRVATIEAIDRPIGAHERVLDQVLGLCV